MKVIRLSKDGIEPAIPEKVSLGKENLFAFCHGEGGMNRRLVKILVSQMYKDEKIEWAKENFELDELLYQLDARYILSKGQEDGRFLVLWDLWMGRGATSFEVNGDAEAITMGQVADEVPAPVVVVSGPSKLTWGNWIAEYDGNRWNVMDKNTYEKEKALKKAKKNNSEVSEVWTNYQTALACESLRENPYFDDIREWVLESKTSDLKDYLKDYLEVMVDNFVDNDFLKELLQQTIKEIDFEQLSSALYVAVLTNKGD